MTQENKDGYDRPTIEALCDYLRANLIEVQAQNRILRGMRDKAIGICIAAITALIVCNLAWAGAVAYMTDAHKTSLVAALNTEITTTKTEIVEEVVEEVVERGIAIEHPDTLRQSVEGDGATNQIINRTENSTVTVNK